MANSTTVAPRCRKVAGLMQQRWALAFLVVMVITRNKRQNAQALGAVAAMLHCYESFYLALSIVVRDLKCLKDNFIALAIL